MWVGGGMKEYIEGMPDKHILIEMLWVCGGGTEYIQSMPDKHILIGKRSGECKKRAHS